MPCEENGKGLKADSRTDAPPGIRGYFNRLGKEAVQVGPEDYRAGVSVSLNFGWIYTDNSRTYKLLEGMALRTPLGCPI